MILSGLNTILSRNCARCAPVFGLLRERGRHVERVGSGICAIERGHHRGSAKTGDLVVAGYPDIRKKTQDWTTEHYGSSSETTLIVCNCISRHPP